MYLRYFIPTFYNALPFGTWRKNIYTNQLPPNIENSFSCLGIFFLVGFCTPHLFWGSGSGHICHLSTRPCKQRIKSPLAPEADRPFPGAHGCPPSRGVRMGPYGIGGWSMDCPDINPRWSDCSTFLVDLMGHLMGIITYHYHFQCCFKALWRYINKCISIPSLQTLHRGTDPTDFAEEILQPK